MESRPEAFLTRRLCGVLKICAFEQDPQYLKIVEDSLNDEPTTNSLIDTILVYDAAMHCIDRLIRSRSGLRPKFHATSVSRKRGLQRSLRIDAEEGDELSVVAAAKESLGQTAKGSKKTRNRMSKLDPGESRVALAFLDINSMSGSREQERDGYGLDEPSEAG